MLRMKAIILAGGLGTRLRHLLPDLPKPMAPVAGRPFLEYVIERLVDADLREIVLSVGYRADAIRDHFGLRWGGAMISYAQEREPLGTGGAIAHAVKEEPAETVLVLNGDTFLDVNFTELLQWHARECRAAPLAMVLRRVEEVDRYGAVRIDAGIVTGFDEKGQTGPGLINAGLYVLNTDLFKRFGLDGRFSLETDLLRARLSELRPKAYATDAFFIDIGVEQDFLRAQLEVPMQFNRDLPE